MSEHLKNLGEYLKTVRKSRKETLEDVAFAIGKSVSTVSRYEKGQIPIDLNTLCALSRHYDVDLTQGISHVAQAESTENPSEAFVSSSFYLYYNDAKSEREIVSILDRKYTESGHHLLLFYDVKKKDDLGSCRNIYTGCLIESDVATHIQVRNTKNQSDKIFVILNPPEESLNEQVGVLICSLEKEGFAPMATKCLLTKEPRNGPISESIANISGSEFRKLKKTNQLIIKQRAK